MEPEILACTNGLAGRAHSPSTLSWDTLTHWCSFRYRSSVLCHHLFFCACSFWQGHFRNKGGRRCTSRCWVLGCSQQGLYLGIPLLSSRSQEKRSFPWVYKERVRGQKVWWIMRSHSDMEVTHEDQMWVEFMRLKISPSSPGQTEPWLALRVSVHPRPVFSTVTVLWIKSWFYC